MRTEKDPSLFQIALSILAAFIGVQNKENFDRDDSYIEKNGLIPYIVMGFFLAACFFSLLYLVVQIVVP